MAIKICFSRSDFGVQVFIKRITFVHLAIAKMQFTSLKNFGEGEGKTTAQKRYMIG
jgi:hypothetical protein